MCFGEFVMLCELCSEVGNDVCCFFYVLCKFDQYFDFDFDLVKSQINENLVYYIQYVYVCVCLVINQWGGDLVMLVDVDLVCFDNLCELVFVSKLIGFCEVIENVVCELVLYLIVFYLKDLVGEFYGWYNVECMLVDDVVLWDVCVVLVILVCQVICNGLVILGVSCLEFM